ncbi:MAG: hypothetical protein QM708_07670 [Propioniciclava sp.]|uniref:hypothetical protein n=1 Tax=Propioniciclava sp. TaxID=2038686 RepID=UPI0039E62490
MSTTQTRIPDSDLDFGLDPARARAPHDARALFRDDRAASASRATPDADRASARPVADEPEETPEPPKLSLSPSGLTAGAMAAVTSAVVGSHLGTAGTLIGAAVGSLVGAVATALYSFSLQRTWHAVRTARRADRGRAADEVATTQTARTAAEPAPAQARASQERATQRGSRRITPVALTAWIAVTAVAAFAVALAVITGIEKVGGASLSGQPGTTVQQVRQARAAVADEPATQTTDRQNQPAGAQVPATPTPQPSASVAEPSVQATPRLSAEPVATPSAPSAPAATPAAEPTSGEASSGTTGSGTTGSSTTGGTSTTQNVGR